MVHPYNGILSTRQLFFKMRQLFLLSWKDFGELVGLVYCHFSKEGRGEQKACFSGGVEGGMEENRLKTGRPVRRLVVMPGKNLNQDSNSGKNVMEVEE